MIDEEMTVRMFGYNSEMLAHQSHKKIVVMCDECGLYRIVVKSAYRDLCFKCGNIAINRKKVLPISDVQLKEEYELGLNTVELAKMYGCCDTLINDRLRFIGCRVRDNKFDLPLLDNELKEKYESGLTTYQLAKECKCSVQPILRKLKEIGCHIRTNAEAQTGKTPSEETRQKMSDARKGKTPSEETRQRRSATRQGIPYDEWESFAKDQLYCPKFNESCRESNREKYGRRCFICGKPELENITTTGKQKKLSVHHCDMDKGQGCDGIRWKLVPLCLKHHGTAHNELWTARIVWLLNNVWNR